MPSPVDIACSNPAKLIGERFDGRLVGPLVSRSGAGQANHTG